MIEGVSSQCSTPEGSKRLVEAATRLGQEHARQHDRFRPHWDEHIVRTRQKILTCAECVRTPGSVTILGAGSAYNIPLVELAQRFATLRLVDIDLAGLEEAVAALPLEVRRRLEIDVADVTGGAAATLLEQGLGAIAAASGPQDALQRLQELASGDCFRARSAPERVKAWRGSCIISSCVSSQLALFPYRALAAGFRRRFASDMSGRFFVDSGLAALREEWVREHGELLAALVMSCGAVYWADTVAETPCLAALGGAPLAAVVEAAVSYLAGFKSARLRELLTDSGKAELAGKYAQVVPLALAAGEAGRRRQGERLLKSFGTRLNSAERRAVTWAVITTVGEGLISPSEERRLVDFVRSTAEQLFPQARQPILQTRFRDLLPEGLAKYGALDSWTWTNDPQAVVTLDGGAYYVEAQILRPEPT